MQNLPTAEVYEKFFEFMPHGKLIEEISSYLVTHIPKRGNALDLMCGPGYLLGKLNEQRPDVVYMGMDIDRGFITHAEKSYPGIVFCCADVCLWNPSERFDVVTCTGGTHHLPDELQDSFIGKISSLIKDGGFALIADPYISDYRSEQERLLAGAKLGYEYLVATIQKGAPPDIIDEAVQTLRNDVLLVEWKTSIKKRLVMLRRYFKHIEMYKTWPAHETDYGDYYFVVRN